MEYPHSILQFLEFYIFIHYFIWRLQLSDQEIEDYLDTNEWQGKAGAYAIQGVASKFVEKIDGDLENVIGMPMYKVIKYLEA